MNKESFGCIYCIKDLIFSFDLVMAESNQIKSGQWQPQYTAAMQYNVKYVPSSPLFYKILYIGFCWTKYAI